MLRLETLTWPEQAALDRARTVVFVPISPLEEHGAHLPLGTDLLVAEALAERAAGELERRRPDLTGLLAPPVPVGCGVMPMLGSIGARQRAVRDVTVAIGRSLARDGFRTIVAVSGHMGLTHLFALEAAARYVSLRYGVAMLAPAGRLGPGVLRGPEIAVRFAALDPPLDAAELRSLATFHHGGMLETSVMLHLHPEHVRPSYRTLPAVPRTAYLGWRGRIPRRFQGYVGDPARARADAGAVVVATLTAAAADLVEQAIARHAPPAALPAGGAIAAEATPEPAGPALDEGAASDPAGPAPGPERRPAAASLLAAALGVLGAAGATLFGVQWWRMRGPRAARGE